MRYSNPSLRLFVVLLQDLHVYRGFITTLIVGILDFTIIPIFTFSGAFVSEIQKSCLRLFVVVLQDLHCLQRFYHNVDHWGIKLYYHAKFHI